MRHTEVPEEAENRAYLELGSTQANMDAFWELIENHYEEEWRVEISGIISLEVDDAMLERILHDNVAVAWYQFGSNAGGMDEHGNRSFVGRPEWLKGLWSIEGVYNNKMAYVGGPRTYAFEPEG
jgi:hypothetical protein